VYLFALLSAMIVLFSSLLVRKAERLRDFEFVVYRDKKGPLYDFFSQGSHILLRGIRPVEPDDFTTSALSNHYAVKGAVVHYSGLIQKDRGDGARKQAPCFLYRFGNFVQFRGRRFAFVYESPPRSLSCRIRVDILVIGGNQRVKIEEVIKCFNAGFIIFDGSNSKWREKLWQRETDGLGVKNYSVGLTGSFFMTL